MKIKRFISLFFVAVLALPFQITGFAFQNTPSIEMDSVYTLTQGTTSDYGYTNYQFKDQDGNFVDLDLDAAQSTLATCSINTAGITIPSRYDAREHGLITSVKDQGYSSSCWSFTSLGAIESDYVSQGLGTVDDIDFSEAHLVYFGRNSSTTNINDPTYGDGITTANPYNKGGNWIYSASTLSRWSGTVNDSDYPFYPYQLSKMGNYSEDERYNTSGGVILKSVEHITSLSQVKSWIMTHGTVETTFYYNLSYLNTGADGTSYYCDDSTQTENHAILIVGWDDNYAATNFGPEHQPSSPGAFLCKNSWNAQWGDNGYFWLSYYDTTIAGMTGYTCVPSTTYDNNYTYNGFGYGGAYKNASENGSQIANVFTSKGYETLSAISTYTLQPNTSVTVYVYTDLPSDYTSPIDGTLKYSSEEMTLANAGYHTISLSSEISLTPNEIFSVVTKLSNSSNTLYVVGEYNSSQTIYSSKARESYIDLTGTNSGWYDSQAYGWKNNCIQAFTKCVHQFETITIPSSCTKTGSIINHCSQCGYETTISTISKSEHAFGPWKQVIMATAANEGKEERICTECGYTESRSIPIITNSTKEVNPYEFMTILSSWINTLLFRLKAGFKEKLYRIF